MLNLKRVEQIEVQWEEIEQSYRLVPYNTPLNLEEEKGNMLTAFAQHKPFNPNFVYKAFPYTPTTHIHNFIKYLQPESNPIDALYFQIAHRELLYIESIETHTPHLITGTTSLRYGLPTNALVMEASRILTAPSSSKPIETCCSPEAVVSQLQDVLQKLHLINWQVLTHKPMSAAMSVNHLDKQLKINGAATFTASDIKRLQLHEIGVHILRGENGAYQPIRLFRSGFPSYLATEEGLAVYHEEQAGLLQLHTLKKYAARILAAHLSLNQSLNDVFYALTNYLDPPSAFDVVARAKRGFTDTAQPGTHTKDIVYLQGYLDIKNHLKNNPEDYPLLFVGKIGIADLPLVRSLWEQQLLVSPKFLPQASGIDLQSSFTH